MKDLEFTIERIVLAETYTEGRMSIDGHYECDTLEDKVRDLDRDGDLNEPGEKKVYGETAIPYGRYRLVVDWSPAFGKKMIHVLDVKEFTGIRFHAGLTVKHTKGCVLVGHKHADGELAPGFDYGYYVDLVEAWNNQGGNVWLTVK